MARRFSLLAGMFLALALAAPAGAHELADDHRDWRSELGFVHVARTVDGVDQAAGTEGEGLPLTWCGEERASDDVTHAVFPPGLQQFKIVYAHPSDRPSRFAQWRDALQANVSLISRFVGAQSGGRKAPRFDMGTSCGPEYVDVQVVALPAVRSTYLNDLAALKSAVRAQIPVVPGQPRNVVVLADHLSSSPAGYWSGIGESYTTEMRGSANPHNTGNLFSALWIPDLEAAPGAAPGGWWPEGMLHEMTHNLGAVGDTAPHSSLAGHCWDGHDVMCYVDQPSPPHAMTYDCPEIAGVMTQVYDCGGDDYFNVAPAAGTYLAEKWNAYDNAYLGACADIAPACGGGTVPGSNPQPPVATTDPVVTGTARVGSVLAATSGQWTNAPSGFAFQWEQGDGGTWLPIPGATGGTYAVGEEDLDLRLRVRVIATNGDGSTAAYSAPTGVVADLEGEAGGEPAREAVATPTTGRATLRVVLGKGRGRRLGTIGFRVEGGTLKASRERVKLARGRYTLRLCTTAGASASKPRCTTRRLKVARTASTRLPALSVRVPAGATGRASYTVKAVGRVFSALTAKRPTLGVLLRG